MERKTPEQKLTNQNEKRPAGSINSSVTFGKRDSSDAAFDEG